MSEPTLKLIQLNVEGSRHLDRILPFLATEQPDVVCLQELTETDIPAFKEVAGAYAVFSPMLRRRNNDRFEYEGTGIISRFPLNNTARARYAGATDITEDYDGTNAETKRRTERFALLSADIEKDGVCFRIATTHFTWTPDGHADEHQRGDIQKLLTFLSPLGELILTGDFNAPRGREIWGALAARYADNVPARYTTSIDGSLHRAGALDLMVDGIFRTPAYMVKDVSMTSGVSDHCALIATISKR